MTRRYGGTGRDYQGAPLIGARIVSGALSSSGLTAGDDGLLRRANNRLYQFNGATLTWELVATNSDALGGATLAQVRDFAQTTGTRTRTAISDFDAGVQALRWASMVQPNAAVPMGGQKFTGAGAATGAGELVEFAQFQAAIANAASGVYYKTPVRVVAITNVALSGLAAIDGVTPTAGDRVLAAAQTDPVQNGIWVAAAGAWTRAADADASGELAPGTTLYVREGTTEGDKLWGLTSEAAVTPGTTAHTWARVGGSGAVYSAGNGGIVVSGTTISAQVAAGGGLQILAGGLALAAGYGVRKLSGVVPSGSTSAVITHNWNTQDVLGVAVRVATAGNGMVVGELVDVDDVATDNNNVTLTFATAPTAGQYRYTLIG